MDVSFTYGNFGFGSSSPLDGLSERDAEIVRLAKEGWKVRDIAAKVGLGVARVYLIGRGHWNGRPGAKPGRNAVRDAEIVRMADEGAKVRDVAARYGLGIARVYRIGRGHWKRAGGNRAGQRVSEAGRAEICQKVIEGGRTLESVGNEYGITKERVRQIVRRSHPEFSRAGIIHAKSVARLARLKKEKYERKASREALIAQAKALIAGGMSKRAAFRQLGLGEGRLFGALKGVSVNHGRWRPAIAELRANLAEHVAARMTNTAIAIKYGVSTHCVASTRKRLGLPPARNKG